MKPQTKFKYTAKDASKTLVTDFITATNEKEAREILTTSDLRIESIKAVLTSGQQKLVDFLADLAVIDYFKDLKEEQRADFDQLIYQNYAQLVGNRKNYTYKLGTKALKLIKND